MAEKIIIDVYRKKNLEEFSEVLSDQASHSDTGCASAAVASMAAALLSRASANASESERVDYIRRNTVTIRNYMTYLIDEDVKCRGPMRKALKEADGVKIEACIQPACAINSEIINMMQTLLEFCLDIYDYVAEESKHYVAEAANLAFSAVKISVSYIFYAIAGSTDETFVYVTKRENGIAVDACKNIVNRINLKANMPYEF